MNHIMCNVNINVFHIFHVFWRNKVKVTITVHHNVKIKIIIHNTDKMKVKATAFTRYFVKNMLLWCKNLNLSLKL